MQGMPPRPEFVALKVRAVIQERGSLFGLVLFLVSTYALLSAMAMTMGGAILDDRLADRLAKHASHGAPLAPRLLTVLTVLHVAEMLCIGGTWMWKRWGIYGYFCINALMILCVFKATGRPPTLEIVAVVAMLFAAFPRLHMFD